MVDDASLDKRRRQNRDSQRRFRQRKKAQRSLSISSANQVGPPTIASAPLLSGSCSASSEHATSYIPSNDRSLLSPGSFSQARVIPTSTYCGDQLYRQTQHYNDPSPSPRLGLPPFGSQFSLDELSMPSTDRDTSYHQQQDFRLFTQAAGTKKDGVFSPKSLLVADLRIKTEPSKPTRYKEMLQPHRRTSESRAERMISDVENLYEFGVNLSLFPEDPSLCNSLRKMKERFRSLATTEVSCGQKSSINDKYEGSMQDSDSDECGSFEG